MTRTDREKSRKKRKRNKGIRRQTALVLMIVLIIILVTAVVSAYAISKRLDQAGVITPVRIVVDGEDITDMTEEAAAEALSARYPWSMSVSYLDKTYPLSNLITPAVKATIAEAYVDASKKQEELESQTLWDRFKAPQDEEPIVLSYEISLPDINDEAAAVAEKVAQESITPATDAAITGYDAESDSFTVSDGSQGTEIDADSLKEKIIAAFSAGDYSAVIQAESVSVEPEISALRYRTIAEYTTHTTANADRNTNVQLAAEAVNGTIIGVGEQMSFNTVVGPRTEEKGYKQAPAYAEGQTVQEYGGGVCQVSSTLYNAVIEAGLRTDERTGHTFKPTYVTPGQDATVSYEKPDFIFTNTSSAPIGIKARYSDRTMTIEIYGVPVLEDGVKRYLESEQISELDPPAPNYVEDPTVPYGTQVVSSEGSKGSVWNTDIVTEKDGVEISREYLHQTRYKGHAGTVKQNTQYPTLPFILPITTDAAGDTAAAAAQ